MTRIDHLTVDDVAGYWVTGPVTVNDLITSSNEAIEWHHNQPARLEQVTTDDWTRQVWRRDLRFGDLLPGVDATVHDIAISGHHTHQRYLLITLPEGRPAWKRPLFIILAVLTVLVVGAAYFFSSNGTSGLVAPVIAVEISRRKNARQYVPLWAGQARFRKSTKSR
jgi:hypothetical protein